MRRRRPRAGRRALRAGATAAGPPPSSRSCGPAAGPAAPARRSRARRAPGRPGHRDLRGRGLPLGHPLASASRRTSPAVGALWDEADLVIAVGARPRRHEHPELGDSRSRRGWSPSTSTPRRLQELPRRRDRVERRRPATGEPWADLRRVRAEACRGARRPRAALPRRARVRAPRRPWWSATCASPATGSAASTRSRAAPAALPPRLGHARLRLPRRHRGRARRRPARPSRSAATAASCSRAASWPPSPRSSCRSPTVIVDDGGYGMLRFDQDQAGEPRFGARPRTPDFEALARAFGLEAETVDGLDDAFGEALAGTSPTRRRGPGRPTEALVRRRRRRRSGIGGGPDDRPFGGRHPARRAAPSRPWATTSCSSATSSPPSP